MKNNLDKHIDAKLKKSFDTFQKKAPEHLWEQISEEIDESNLVDESLDEKVQKAHKELPLKTAPASIWEKIEDSLEGHSSVDDVLDEKVKDGFLSDAKNVAPAFLWGAISSELNNPPISIDTTLDDKLKEGFLTQENKKTPNKVWYGVSRQLNIDKTWSRISKVLDTEPIVSDWRGRMLRFFAGAAVFLLLLKTCNHEPYNVSNPSLVEQVQSSIEPSSKEKFSKKTIKATADDEKKSRKNAPNSMNSAKVKEPIKINENLITPIPTQATKYSSSDKKKRVKSKKTLVVSSKEEEDKIAASSEKRRPIATIDLNVNSGNAKSDLDEKVNPIVLNNEKALQENTKTSVSNQEEEVSTNREALNWAILDVLAIESLPVVNSMEPIRLLESKPVEPKTKKSLVEGKLEAGAFAVVNSTMLLNNETREGFDQNSLTTNYFGLAANYGLWASYRILPKGAIVAEFSINADNRQAYGTYDKGVFYIKEWVMKYNRFSLAYKHNLWQSNSDKLINTKVVAQAGVYLGLMREAKLFYDGVLFFDKQSDYHQFDFGFKVALGQEILIDKFVLGYGIRSDIGAANIFKGNTILNSQEDQTNIIHLGGYVLFGYRF